MTSRDPRLHIPAPAPTLGQGALAARIKARIFDAVAPPAPVVVGRFHIEGKLAAGGMGVVYRATDPKLDRSVALKFPHPDSVDGQDRARLQREATTLAKLSHPNVVGVYEVGEHDDALFIVMELAQGETLDAWQSNAMRTLAEILDVYLQAMAGLAAVHALGIVHRDFKPANVLVGSDGRVRVLDFGLARAPTPITGPVEAGHGSDAETNSAAPCGTLPYMAPEQAAGFGVTTRSDQFSLCMCLYESLFGARPFTYPQLRAMGIDPDAAVALRFGRSAAPTWLRRILARGLAADPAQRWPSIPALMAAIERGPRLRRAAARSALGVGSLAIVGYTGTAVRPEPCPAPVEEIAAAWSPARRHDLRAASRAAGLAFAEQGLAHAANDLDDWAARWVAARQETCLATWVEGRQSEARLDATTACLDRAKQRFVAGLELLEHADANTLSRADAVVAELGAPRDCLRSDLPTPGIGAAHAQALATEAQCDLAGLQIAAGAVDAAKTTASEAMRLAEGVGDPSLRARALLVRGRVEYRADDIPRARASWLEAVKIAESVRDDDIAAEGWCRLVSIAALDLEDTTLARDWLDRSEAAVARLDGRPTALACHEQAAATVAAAAGDSVAGIAAQRRALAAWARNPDPVPLRVDEAEQRLAQLLDDAGEVDQAKVRYEARLADRQRRLGPLHPMVATAHYDLARLHRQAGETNEARREAQLAVEVLSQTLGDQALDTASAMTELASVYVAQEQPDAAIALASKARDVQLRLAHGPVARTGALAVLANAQLLVDNKQAALAVFLQMAEELPARVPLRAEVEFNTGELLRELSRPDEARHHFEWVVEHLDDADFLVLAAKVSLSAIALERGAAQEAATTLAVVLPKLEGQQPPQPEFVAEARLTLERAQEVLAQTE